MIPRYESFAYDSGVVRRMFNQQKAWNRGYLLEWCWWRDLTRGGVFELATSSGS